MTQLSEVQLAALDAGNTGLPAIRKLTESYRQQRCHIAEATGLIAKLREELASAQDLLIIAKVETQTVQSKMQAQITELHREISRLRLKTTNPGGDKA